MAEDKLLLRALADPALTEAPRPLKALTTHPMGLEARGASRCHIFPDGGLETWPPLWDLERHPLVSDLEKEGLPPTLGAGHPENVPRSGEKTAGHFVPCFSSWRSYRKQAILPSPERLLNPLPPRPPPRDTLPWGSKNTGWDPLICSFTRSTRVLF